MLLTISTTRQPATDLGYLLHKHPGRCQTFDLSFGKAHVFYPEATEKRCVACLLLDVDPVGLVHGKGHWKEGLLDQYVNDRPFVVFEQGRPRTVVLATPNQEYNVVEAPTG